MGERENTVRVEALTAVLGATGSEYTFFTVFMKDTILTMPTRASLQTNAAKPGS